MDIIDHDLKTLKFYGEDPIAKEIVDLLQKRRAKTVN